MLKCFYGEKQVGCLKKIIKSIILCLAVIGFISIGGKDFVMTKWNEYQSFQHKNAETKATKIGDFSHIGDEFEISKSASMFGYNGVIAEHKASGQKMVILDTHKKELITPEDINNNQVDKKFEQLTKKFRYSAIKIQDLKMGSKGTITMFGKTVPYVKFSAKVTKMPFGEVDGMVSSYKDGEENLLLISVNEKNKYSQLISQEFYKKIKK